MMSDVMPGAFLSNPVSTSSNLLHLDWCLAVVGACILQTTQNDRFGDTS